MAGTDDSVMNTQTEMISLVLFGRRMRRIFLGDFWLKKKPQPIIPRWRVLL